MKHTWSREMYFIPTPQIYLYTILEYQKGHLFGDLCTLCPKKAINTQRWALSIKSVTIKIAIYLVI